MLQGMSIDNPRFPDANDLSDKFDSPRSFLKRAYPTMKKANPETPILIREASGVEPKIYARFGMDTRLVGLGVLAKRLD